MSRTIQDEFTALPMSRQMRCIMRKLRDGKCMTCGAPRVNAKHCAKHRDYANKLHRTTDKANPTKAKARTAVMLALRRGEITRGNCHCGKPGFAHHEDYAKPLQITWVCHAHHCEAHGKKALRTHVPFISGDYKEHYAKLEKQRPPRNHNK